MMALSVLSFSTAVNKMAAAAQAAATAVFDFTIGSPLRAIFEANAAVLMWVQWTILQVLAKTRAATSVGSDLDTWMADFTLTRLPAVAASGQATFARFSATVAAILPVGTQVKTADGSLTFSVTEDATNGLWNAVLNGYLIPSGTASVTVPVVAAIAGVSGNIQAGTLTLIASSLAGIDTVTNANPYTNGTAAETDTAFRARFAAFLQGLRESTLSGIQAAIASVQAGIFSSIASNSDGTVTVYGLVTVFIDDGTGSPSTTLINSVTTAVDAAVALGVRVAVRGPNVTTANVVMTITTASGYTHATVVSQVQSAITAMIDALGFGGALHYTALALAAYAASPGVTNVTGVTLNGGSSDITPDTVHVVRAGTIAVT